MPVTWFHGKKKQRGNASTANARASMTLKVQKPLYLQQSYTTNELIYILTYAYNYHFPPVEVFRVDSSDETNEKLLAAMLEKILPEEVEQQEHMTLIEVVVNETLDQTFVSELRLPDSCLITSQIHHGKSRIVKGNSQLFMGDSLLVAVPISQIHTVRKILEGA